MAAYDTTPRPKETGIEGVSTLKFCNVWGRGAKSLICKEKREARFFKKLTPTAVCSIFVHAMGAVMRLTLGVKFLRF